MAACLTSASCLAIDVGPVGCVLHSNVEDLSDSYNYYGVTQFLLNRDCLLSTPLSENFTETAGIKLVKLYQVFFYFSFRRRTHNVYNGCLAGYNIVLTPRIPPIVKYSQLRQSANICDVSKRPINTIAMTTNKEYNRF